MQVEAHFENIKEIITHELRRANESIFVAVAWFTDQELLNCLIEKALNVKVNLLYLDDDINKGKLNFGQLNSMDNASVFAYPYEEGDQLMHHKFCVIDRHTVITGSYNWSFRAQSNKENITVTKDNESLAIQFISQFGKITKEYCGASAAASDKVILDISKLLKRLGVIKNFIMLEDFEDVTIQLNKLRPFGTNGDIANILLNLDNKEYSSAIQSIDRFANQYQQIILFDDPEIFALRLEIKALEMELSALSIEKSEVEKLILDFGVLHNKILGDLVKKILKIRKDLTAAKKNESEQKNKEFEEAKRDYEEYHKQFEETKNKILFDLTHDQENQLKKKFRKASLMCHPDRVAEELKEHAQSIFIELQEAYAQNDLDRVNEILNMLENKKPFISRSEKYAEKNKLKAEAQRLRLIMKELEKEIRAIKATPTYVTIQEIENWDIYFEKTKEALEKQLRQLETSS
ncbi:MAG: phospholipase D-like domain-containing protein [Eudoraea sp.]|uniref:phospholipase D-like domain-containing protein n=1 Tax=Eudoraea sp. TaxID=1979955 RepID=UPI003263445B